MPWEILLHCSNVMPPNNIMWQMLTLLLF